MTKRLFTSALVLAILLAGGELAARMFFAHFSAPSAVLFPRYEADYKYGPYTLRGTRARAEFWHASQDGSWRFVTNDRGFRSTRDYPYTKPVGTLRVLSLGGADAFGYEARQEYTYASVAERYLRRHQTQAEVINAAVADASSADALAFMIGEGYRYSPDVVVLALHARDFARNTASGLFALGANGQLKEAAFENAGAPIAARIAPWRWVTERSYLVALISPRSAHAAEVVRPGEREVELQAAILERLQRICTARGARFIVVDIPQLDGQSASSSLPQPLRERMARLGVESISADELLAPYYGGPEMHVAHGERHVSEFTHALIGVELGRRLLKRP
jgi:hypothetical protein